MVAIIRKIKGAEKNRNFYRKFGAHEYWNSGEVHTKERAIKRSNELKQEGYFVRITKSTIASDPYWYTIWVSPKTGD